MEIKHSVKRLIPPTDPRRPMSFGNYLLRINDILETGNKKDWRSSNNV
jgi:hypothetical protein